MVENTEAVVSPITGFTGDSCGIFAESGSSILEPQLKRKQQLSHLLKNEDKMFRKYMGN